MYVSDRGLKLGLQYDTDDARDTRGDTRMKTPSRCQNADADAVPFTISFDEHQRRATTRMLIIIVYKSL